jgi:hypothetical protein
MKSDQKRRSFLKKGLLGGLGLYGVSSGAESPGGVDYDAIPGFAGSAAKGKSVIDLKVDPIKQVKVALIGIGSRGTGHVSQFASLFPDKAAVTG